jgi:hypothetical protein
MENKRKNLVAGVVFAGALIAGSSLSANASNALSFNSLGSGAELRSELLESGNGAQFNFEAKCGEKSAESKSGEAKCGE